ncbi:hypothetical protein HOBO_100 [Bacillus phage Hobo]|uniref:Uncharacterized protein n=2 Tax=Caeruleovirus BM15 TaxID=1985178 RepID=A0A0S2MUD5_9CAUD|nr:tail protein [Bacillus phage BM15]ALO79507.1 hypothetical protein BM10_103 [Bacillus phage BM15]AXQ66861.1 hypothetical protein HOBO_100 [Bacillus phage Hobo]
MARITGQITISDLNDAKQYILYLNPNYKTQIYDPNGLTYVPDFTSSNLVIKPELYIAGGDGSSMLPSASVKSVFWYEGTQTTVPLAETAGGTTPSGLSYSLPTGTPSTTAKILTIKSNLATMTSQIFTCVVTYTDTDLNMDVTLKANYDVTKIVNGSGGSNAIVALLSNDSQSIPTDSAGNNGVYAGSGTEIHVYDGATELTHDGTGTANGKYKVTASATNITAGAITTSGIFAVVAQASNITQDTASITFTITGKSLKGQAFTLTKVQTLSKVKGGAAPTAYWLVPSTVAIQKNISGTLIPASISVSMMSQTGAGSPAFYGGKLIIAESTDGTNYTDKYTSSANEPGAKAYTPSSNTVKAIRIRMYLAGSTPNGTVNNVDEQQIVIVSDGSNGVDSYYLNLWAPGGDSIRNSGGNVTLEADMYKGASTVTPTAFQWYIQDPNATTSSGGNADGGNGWRLITNVANATTAPTLALVPNANTQLTAATYYVKYTWCGLSGETIGSTQASLAVTAGNDLKVTIPAFATNVSFARVYIGTAAANLYYAGDIKTSAGSVTISKFDNTAEAIPTTTSANIATTSDTIVVRNWAINGVQGFKCVATAPGTGVKYSAVIVARDFQDPMVMNIIGANVFKNGQGTITLTAQILQSGLTVSTAGWTFTWALYGTNGNIIKNYPTIKGDTITLDSTDVNGSANLLANADK